MKNKLKKRSLILKINIAILFTYAIVVLFFGAAFIETEKKRETMRLESIKLLMSSVFQQNRERLANEIFGNYRTALAESIKNIQEFKGIAHIEIFDSKGMPIISTYENSYTEKELNKSSLKNIDTITKANFIKENVIDSKHFAIYISPVKVIGECYGFIKIYYDLADLRHELLYGKMIFAGQLCATTVILFGLLNLLLFKIVIKPATILQKGIRTLLEGRLGEQVDVTSRDELGEIAQAFNMMSKQLLIQRAALEDSKEMLQLVIDNIPGVIYWKNKKLEFLGCNKNFVKIAGLQDSQQILGKKDYELDLDKKTIDLFEKHSKKVMESDSPAMHIRHEFDLEAGKGFIDVSFIPLHNSEGKVTGILCTYEDITEKIKSKEEKKNLEIQLMHAGRLTAMGEMASGIAHEINQPLAIMKVVAGGLISRFSKTDPDGYVHKSAEKISKQVTRASAIIDNMRSFARVKNFMQEPVDITEPLNQSLSFFKEQFRINSIILDINIQDNLPKAKVDPQKFEQIAVNLLTNARFAVTKKSETTAEKEYRKEVRVSMRLADDKKSIIFEVADNGIGMEPGVKEHCMEPFFTTKDVGEGTGLGLSIVHAIAAEFKIIVSVESEKDKGTYFLLAIPVYEEKDEKDRKNSSSR